MHFWGFFCLIWTFTCPVKYRLARLYCTFRARLYIQSVFLFTKKMKVLCLIVHDYATKTLSTSHNNANVVEV